jgi:hypothetical protein
MRYVRRSDGSYAAFVAHQVATMDQHMLALQLDWLAAQLSVLGDGREAHVIGADGRGWTLTRGTSQMAGRWVYCMVLLSASEARTCPLGHDPCDWLKAQLGRLPRPLFDLDEIPF